MTPAQRAESGVVAIGRDPLTAGFDREGREVRVRDKVAARAGLLANVAEDLPVTLARRDDDGVRLLAKRVAESEGMPRRARR